MKRTNLVLDEHLLDEAVRLSGERTYSAAVTKALNGMIRSIKSRRLLEFAGSGIWQGNLANMREDQPRRRNRKIPATPHPTR